MYASVRLFISTPLLLYTSLSTYSYVKETQAETRAEREVWGIRGTRDRGKIEVVGLNLTTHR